MYNELAILKMTQSLNAIAKNPPVVFKEEIIEHFKKRSNDLIERLEAWLDVSKYQNSLQSDANNENATTQERAVKLDELTKNQISTPDFPLLPGSKGFCISLKKAIAAFKETIEKIEK